MHSIIIVPIGLICIEVLFIVVSTIFFLSGLDDFFVDACHTGHAAHRLLFRRLFRRFPDEPTEAQLSEKPEQLIAIVIPAWDESAVIGSMLENALRTVNYRNYHIFVGTYPNDPDTGNAVENIGQRFHHVHCVVCAADGPTTKADCLNWVFHGIRTYEREHALRFQIFVMHDAEDVLHALELKLFNHLIPANDMVQLPIQVLQRPLWHFTAGHYLDEFAEYHSKDLPVRAMLTGNIPSAGTGTGFSRHGIDVAMSRNEDQLFTDFSLTEDYDLGVRLGQYGLKSTFARYFIRRVTTKRSLWTARTRQVSVNELIAIREYLPDRFSQAVRQKGRWVAGIALQGWRTLGWRGNGWMKYMFVRDRKALIANPAIILGYIVLLLMSGIWFVGRYSSDSYHHPVFSVSGTWFWYVMMADTLFMFSRLFQRAFYVNAHYGWQQALVSVPRAIWSPIINFASTIRAVRLFAGHVWTGREIAWDKTAHVFPTESALREYRHRLGELLLQGGFLTARQLDAALKRQTGTGQCLGAILLDMGLMDEADLLHALGTQMRLPIRHIDPYEIPLDVLRAVPFRIAVQYSVFPLERHSDWLLLATSVHLDENQITEIRDQLGSRVELTLTGRGDLAFAIRHGYERLERAESQHELRLGEKLVRRGLITTDQLGQALHAQRKSYARLGDILLREGSITARALQDAIASYAAQPTTRLGSFLVASKAITNDQLSRALDLQRKVTRRLGEIVVDMGMISENSLIQVLEHAS